MKHFAGDSPFAVVRVFYATDRTQTGSKEPSKKFGPEQGDLTYGSCEVSIPRDHRMGELESPSIWKLEFRPDPEKHVVLLSAESQNVLDFYGEVRHRVDQSTDKKAFVFVHGYNVGFEEAARRTAQISYDLSFDGAPIFFSWPSQGNLAGYRDDETNVAWAEKDLKLFLSDLAERTSARTVYLIAHSMGNRALTGAFLSLLESKQDLASAVFKEIILAAPDIDAEVFKKDIAPRLIASKSHVTLYASSKDLALDASRKFHKNEPRAGDSGHGLVVLKGLDTIDATNVDVSLLGHSYYADNASMLSDIYYLFKYGIPAHDRFRLAPVTGDAGTYWRFQKEK
jgi:esterase/lipase superfamily enzyme